MAASPVWPSRMALVHWPKLQLKNIRAKTFRLGIRHRTAQPEAYFKPWLSDMQFPVYRRDVRPRPAGFRSAVSRPVGFRTPVFRSVGLRPAVGARPSVGVRLSADRRPAVGARPSADLRRSADGRPSADLRPVGLRPPVGARPSVDLRPPAGARPSVDLRPPVGARPSVDLRPPVGARPSVELRPLVGARPSADLRRSADGRPSAGLRPVGLRLSLFQPSLLSGRAPGALSKRLDELSALVFTAVVSGLPGFAVLKLEDAGLVPGRLDDLGPPLPAAGFSDRAALRATARSASGDNCRSPPSRL